jgi:hypothetical protein
MQNNIYLRVNPNQRGLSGCETEINFSGAAFRIKLDVSRQLYISGEVFYHIQNPRQIKLLDLNCGDYLKKIFLDHSLQEVISTLEGQYLGILVDKSKNTVTIFTDRYTRLDYFYSIKGGEFFLATDLDYIFQQVRPEYDQKMLAHLFSVYGWYTPKGKTIYKNVQRLQVGEILTISPKGIESRSIKFNPVNIEDFTDADLPVYEKLLRESVVARANRKGKTWVSSSSGWDSSILLGLLVDELGAKNVSMLTGSMKYSQATKTINLFEINKIKKIGQFYGLKPEIVDLDFKSAKAPDYWKKVLPYYRSKHMYSYVSFNFARLADKLSAVAGSGQTIFNGETSDSFHNFGFSQFVTFFHTKKSFTEYADKMNCYFYGPSFLKKALSGTYEKDKVLQIFKKMYSGLDLESSFSSRDSLIESYLFPFFYGGPRIPFAKTYLNPALTSSGQKKIYQFPFREYLPEALGLTEKNLYSWLIHMYHSFHSQGSTVSIQKHSMEHRGHHWRSPFNDYRLIDFLSRAPEKWGRGLELNNTKYPLKWVAKNRMKFPYELLDEGPHSYLYDVIEGFSLFEEITYRSGVTLFFKETLRGKSYKTILTDECFDMRYLDGLVNGYLSGKQVKGADFNNLVSLITLCVTGWY